MSLGSWFVGGLSKDAAVFVGLVVLHAARVRTEVRALAVGLVGDAASFADLGWALDGSVAAFTRAVFDWANGGLAGIERLSAMGAGRIAAVIADNRNRRARREHVAAFSARLGGRGKVGDATRGHQVGVIQPELVIGLRVARWA